MAANTAEAIVVTDEPITDYVIALLQTKHALPDGTEGKIDIKTKFHTVTEVDGEEVVYLRAEISKNSIER